MSQIFLQLIFSFRIVFRRDLVPHLPTCKMIEPERPGEGTSKPCDADDIHAFYHHGMELQFSLGKSLVSLQSCMNEVSL